MEWGKAKTILIFTFLLLNVLLGLQLWNHKIQLAGNYFDNRAMAQETEQILRNRNIAVLQEIPKETPQLSEITVKYHPEYHQDQRVFLSEPMPVEEVLYTKSIREPLASVIANSDEYAFDPVNSENGIYRYNQLHEGFPLFDVSLTFYSHNGHVTAFKQQYVDIVHSGETENQRVLSAYMAVRHLAENVLSPGAVIEDVRLGYHGTIYNTDSILLFPKWRISIQDGNLYYIHAVNGALEEVERTSS